MCDQKSYEAKPDSKETPKPTMMDELTAVKKKYEDLAKEAKIKETQGVKRKPLPDGTLPLTKPELATFNKTHFLKVIKKVYIREGYIYMQWVDMDIPITNYKAILWLADRFDLTSNN